MSLLHHAACSAQEKDWQPVAGHVQGDPRYQAAIAPVLVFPDSREWQGTFPELTLNYDHLLLKGDLKG